MQAISSTPAVNNGAAAASTAATGNAASSAFGLSFESLLKIILTQLTYQDPLKPIDNTEFVSQLAQFSQIQLGQTTNDKLGTLVSAQGAIQASGLLGKTIDIPSGTTVISGKVTAISFSNGDPQLTITTGDNQTISGLSLANVTQIRQGIEMFGSIYIGLSGLAAYSHGLQQISANVANLNSQGFKGSTVSFQNLLGGNDGSQGSVGSGVNNVPSRLDFAQGELRQTDRDLDLGIQGSGLLMLMRGSDLAYTRTGSFEVDKDGFIVLSGTQWRLATLDDAGKPQSLSVDVSRTNSPKPTTKITLGDNLASDGTTASVSSINVYDATGAKHVWSLKFDKDTSSTAAAGTWNVTVTDANGAVKDSTGAAITKQIHFIGGTIDPATSSLALTDAASGASVTVDLTGVTSYSFGGTSNISARSVDGYGLGTFATLSVNDKGQLEIGYSNEQKQQLGSVALVDFRDTSALTQQAGGLFLAPDTTPREILASGDSRIGKVQSRRLEASNVDLTLEFSDLILVQRGFQASSQIISATNDMIQQLFGIRGQG